MAEKVPIARKQLVDWFVKNQIKGHWQWEFWGAFVTFGDIPFYILTESGDIPDALSSDDNVRLVTQDMDDLSLLELPDEHHMQTYLDQRKEDPVFDMLMKRTEKYDKETWRLFAYDLLLKYVNETPIFGDMEKDKDISFEAKYITLHQGLFWPGGHAVKQNADKNVFGLLISWLKFHPKAYIVTNGTWHSMAYRNSIAKLDEGSMMEQEMYNLYDSITKLSYLSFQERNYPNDSRYWGVLELKDGVSIRAFITHDNNILESKKDELALVEGQLRHAKATKDTWERMVDRHLYDPVGYFEGGAPFPSHDYLLILGPTRGFKVPDEKQVWKEASYLPSLVQDKIALDSESDPAEQQMFLMLYDMPRPGIL